jgi:hypothetical protein
MLLKGYFDEQSRAGKEEPAGWSTEQPEPADPEAAPKRSAGRQPEQAKSEPLNLKAPLRRSFFITADGFAIADRSRAAAVEKGTHAATHGAGLEAKVASASVISFRATQV